MNMNQFTKATELVQRRNEVKKLLLYFRDMTSFNLKCGSREEILVSGSLRDSLASGLAIELNKIDGELHDLGVRFK